MQFQNILIPTDFSGAAEPAVQHALTLAAREQAQILLLHVLPGMGVPGPEDTRQATAYGVLDLTLRDGSYDWRFAPVGGGSYRDSGTAGCR